MKKAIILLVMFIALSVSAYAIDCGTGYNECVDNDGAGVCNQACKDDPNRGFVYFGRGSDTSTAPVSENCNPTDYWNYATNDFCFGKSPTYSYCYLGRYLYNCEGCGGHHQVQDCGAGACAGGDVITSGGNSWCIPKAAIGAACSANGQCQSGHCAYGKCVLGEYLNYCDDATDCNSPYFCVAAPGNKGMCRDGLLGSVCLDNSHCLNGICGLITGGSGHCIKCETDSHCESTKFCIDWMMGCWNKQPNGGYCERDGWCQSGYCSGGICAKPPSACAVSGEVCTSKTCCTDLNLVCNTQNPRDWSTHEGHCCGENEYWDTSVMPNRCNQFAECQPACTNPFNPSCAGLMNIQGKKSACCSIQFQEKNRNFLTPIIPY